MSQQTVADLAALNYKYIGRVELGKADPGADVLVRIARALSVPVGELFETVTPSASGPRLLPAADVENVTAAMKSLTTAIDRLLSPQPRPTRARARRRVRR